MENKKPQPPLVKKKKKLGLKSTPIKVNFLCEAPWEPPFFNQYNNLKTKVHPLLWSHTKETKIFPPSTFFFKLPPQWGHRSHSFPCLRGIRGLLSNSSGRSYPFIWKNFRWAFFGSTPRFAHVGHCALKKKNKKKKAQRIYAAKMGHPIVMNLLYEHCVSF